MESLNIVDAIIILIILLGGVIGFKEGVIKRLTSVIGLVVVIILSFMLKNFISVLFYENLPFFKFGGIFKGVTVLNIVLYEFIAFLLVFLVLRLLLRKLLSLFHKLFLGLQVG